MKAWHVRDEARGNDFATIVFAETRGKAHALAMRTDACEDAEWIDVRVTRMPSCDSAYRGIWELDWFNEADRLVLVRDANFVCSYEYDYADCDCDQCPATEYCYRYESMHEEDE